MDAKIMLTNLSSGYVEDLGKEFPVGNLVTGNVLSVNPSFKLVEVTLKTANASRKAIGDIISGRIKQIELFGVFITINNTNMTGLCRVLEPLYDHIDSIDKYRVDEERWWISLGLKPSYIKMFKTIYFLQD